MTPITIVLRGYVECVPADVVYSGPDGLVSRLECAYMAGHREYESTMGTLRRIVREHGELCEKVRTLRTALEPFADAGRRLPPNSNILRACEALRASLPDDLRRATDALKELT
jgi:hypothetical protein